MAANVNLNPPAVPEVPTVEVPFLEKHFAKIAFAISSLVLLIFSSLFLFLGSVAGFSLHYSLEPELKIKEDTQVITLSHAVFAIVGAVAALIRIFPAGASGGLVFQSIPLMASMAVGSAAYRGFKSR